MRERIRKIGGEIWIKNVHEKGGGRDGDVEDNERMAGTGSQTRS